jgi:hypothetical protein
VDRNDPRLPANEQTPGWEPVVGTTYEPQDERPSVPEHDGDTFEEHVEGEDTTGYDRR